MEAVAPDALIVKAARQREDVVDERMVAVKRGVETGDLPRRQGLASRQDPGDIMRLMQWRERDQLLKRPSTSSVTITSAPYRYAAMDHAMAGGDNLGVGRRPGARRGWRQRLA